MDLVDWGLASRVGGRVAPKGPDIPIADARRVVAQLQASADAAVDLVAGVSQLQAPLDDNTVVVDRPMWIDSNLAGLAQLTRPLGEVLAERAGGRGPAQAAGAAISGAQLGAALGWMSGKVLGQYEIFVEVGMKPRLLLVAPNIVAAQQAMDVPEADFQLWVCLHEEAHRVQFGASPWLADHFTAEVGTFLMAADVGAGDAMKRVLMIARALVKVIGGDQEASLVQAVQNPAQQEIFERLSALMSLLEGHAEWVMDAVGPTVIPSLPRLRERLQQRRANPGQADGLLRRLMGMDAKLRQYSGGRAFVTAVVDQVGVDGFNQIWDAPQTLPTLDEINDPQQWVARVHGTVR